MVDAKISLLFSYFSYVRRVAIVAHKLVAFYRDDHKNSRIGEYKHQNTKISSVILAKMVLLVAFCKGDGEKWLGRVREKGEEKLGLINFLYSVNGDGKETTTRLGEHVRLSQKQLYDKLFKMGHFGSVGTR